MRIYGVRVFVHDYPAARAFYAETLGLNVAWEMAEHEAVGFAASDAQLIVECIADDAEEMELVGRFVGLSLQVDDIQATYRQLQDRGVVFDQPPERQSWGGSLAHFKDPAGNTLTLLR